MVNLNNLDSLNEADLAQLEATLESTYQSLVNENLALDLTRGKPSSEQLSLSNKLDGILNGNYTYGNTDLRNYGGLDGLPEAKALFSQVLNVSPEETLIGGNSSLTLMYFTMMFALYQGVTTLDSAWGNDDEVKFLCPVPGYDRHFSVCEQLGITMIPIAMNDNGPDMDQVEQLVKEDHSIKGIWCVPRFSNPTGIVYSDETVQRMAKLGKIAAPNFRIFWDNAYALHALDDDAPQLASIMDACKQQQTEDSVYIFGSTSKVTFAGSGVAFMGASQNNINTLKKHFAITTIGPDKTNQARHLYFLKDIEGFKAHMQKHAAILKPRFDIVLKHLNEAFSDNNLGTWTTPQGGYFVSFDTQAGLANKVIRLADQAGVKITPAGATFPYGEDPNNSNIRIAPSVPSQAEVDKAMKVFVLCVQLATVRHHKNKKN